MKVKSWQTFGSSWLHAFCWLIIASFTKNYFLWSCFFFHISPHFSCHFLSFSGHAPPVAIPGLTSGLQNERGSFPLNVWAQQRSCGLCLAGSHSSSSLKLLCGAESWMMPGPSGPACRINKNIHQRRLLFSETHNEELTKQCSIYVSL